MTGLENTTIILLSIIALFLFIIVSHIPFKTDKETKELLKQICNNTKDKTKPVKPVNVSANAETTKWAYCPICKRAVHSNEKYFDRCGTGLDLSDTELLVKIVLALKSVTLLRWRAKWKMQRFNVITS